MQSINTVMKLSEKKRIVVKLGTSTLAHATGRMNLRRMHALVQVLADLQNAGHELVIVSSGAVGLGAAKLGFRSRPTDTPTKQAAAAVGQCELMYMYDKLFSDYNLTVAQILLTKAVLGSGTHHVENTFERLLSMGVIPIVNENDTVAIDELELEIGENDSLSAMVATLSKADLLVILTDIDGLYSGDPRSNADARLIPVVETIDDTIIAAAGGAGSAFGTGGMATKIHAAELATKVGIDMVIVNGKDPNILYDLLFENKSVGTLFLAQKEAAL